MGIEGRQDGRPGSEKEFYHDGFGRWIGDGGEFDGGDVRRKTWRESRVRVGNKNDGTAERFHDRVAVVRDGGDVGGQAGVAGEGFEGITERGGDAVDIIEGEHPGVARERLEAGGRIGEFVERRGVGIDEGAQHAGERAFAGCGGSFDLQNAMGFAGVERGFEPGGHAFQIAGV